MYLESNKCAQCGKAIGETSQFTPHNVALKGVAPELPTELRPLFCSPECVAEVSWPTWKAEQQKELQDGYRVGLQVKIRKEEELYEWLRSGLDLSETADIQRVKERNLDDEYMAEEFTRVKQEHRAKRRDLDSSSARTKRNLHHHFDKQILESNEKCAALKPSLAPTFLWNFFSQFAQARTKALEPAPLPKITDHHRFEHTQILGPSGSGKTTLIQDLALDILERKDEPAIIIIDPKGFMVDRISRLRTFYPGVDIGDLGRLIIIDATKSPAPPLNLFSQTGTPAAINYAINNFDYLFAQAGVELTDRMRPIFRHCARLMFSIPHADISLFKELLESKPDDPRFQAYIAKLTDEGARRFFSKDFYGESYKKTRESVKERFDQITSLDTRVQAAFSSPSPPLDFGKILADGKIVLVNADFTDIGVAESKFIGRHIINQVLGAAFSRGRGGRPAFLFIDEFQDFVDEQSTPKQFRLAREYNLGIICAHQQMFCPELSDTLRSTLSSTTIKYVSKLGGKDRGYMLNDLDCTEEFLNRQVPDHDNKLVKFGVFVKGQPPSSIAIKYANITPEMQMPKHIYNVVIQYNLLCLHPEIEREVRDYENPPGEPASAPDSPPTAKDHDPDAATDWPRQ
jgi:hypothetical protein